MKVLIALLVIVAGAWLWRRSRHLPARAAAAPPPKPAGDPQPMLRCACCGLHLPADSAITGRNGRAYCCPAHRQQTEGG